MAKTRKDYVSLINKLVRMAEDPAASPNEKEQALSRISTLLAEHKIEQTELGEKSNVQHISLQFQNPGIRNWPVVLGQCVGYFYQTMILSIIYPQDKLVRGLIIIGDELAIKTTHSILLTLYPQFDQMIRDYCTNLMQTVVQCQPMYSNSTTAFWGGGMMRQVVISQPHPDPELAIESFALGLIQGLQQRLHVIHQKEVVLSNSRDLVITTIENSFEANKNYAESILGTKITMDSGQGKRVDHELFIQGLQKARDLKLEDSDKEEVES